MVLIKALRFTLAISLVFSLSACNLAIQEKLSTLDFNLRKSLNIDGLNLPSIKTKKNGYCYEYTTKGLPTGQSKRERHHNK